MNHRYLDVRVRLPLHLAEHSAVVEDCVRRALGAVAWRWSAGSGGVCGPPVLDRARARGRSRSSAICATSSARRGGAAHAALVRARNLFGGRAERDRDERAPRSRPRATRRATPRGGCGREGAALVGDLRQNLRILVTALESVRARAPHVVDAYRQRLRQRIERLLADAEVALDEGRLEHEVALFADRADVSEEVARLGSHLDQARALLDAGGDAASRSTSCSRR